MIQDLAYILVVAGIVTLLFKALKQPLVLGYIVAGFLVSPHMPYTFQVVNDESIHTWADIGVMFLLFSLGLDFSFKKIFKMGVSPFVAAITIVFSMIMAGICVGKLFGWSQMNSLFLGGMLAMSSTTIIYKAFDDLGMRQQKFTSLVMSVLILEDILAIVLMVMLSSMAKGNANSETMLDSIIRIGFFLILWFVVGLFVIPTFFKKVRKYMNAETLTIVALGLCCLMAVISTQVGFSSAFGAFVMGSILAETVEAERIEKLIEPVKNLFGAIFFVSVGMLVDPMVLVKYAIPTLVITLTIIVGQATLGSIGYLLSGQTLKNAMRCGFSMAQIGEFAFIIAGLGLSLGVVSEFLYPVVVAVSVITTFLTPYMIRGAVPAYNALEKILPKVWISQINRISKPEDADKNEGSDWHRYINAILANTCIYSVLSVAAIALMLTFFLPFIRSILPHWWANGVCGLATVLLISPFLRAMVVKKNRSEEFKALWMINHQNRMLLIATILARVIIAMSMIFYICNYLSRFSHAIMISIALLVIVCMVLSQSLKKHSIMLERMFLQNLRQRDIAAQVSGKKRPLFEGRLLDRDLHITEIKIPEESTWAGKSLKQLNLGSKYKVSVSSILRGKRLINIPNGDDIVFPNDILHVIGEDDHLSALNAALQAEVYPDDLDYEKHEMKLHRIILHKDKLFIGKTLITSGLRDKYNCMLVGIEEGEESLSKVSPDRMFEVGDILWIVGEKDDVEKVLRA